MAENAVIYHKRHPGCKLRVISPASLNGGKVIICEILIGSQANLIIQDSPVNFYPA